MITAYRELGPERGRELIAAVMKSVGNGVPAALSELITLGGR